MTLLFIRYQIKPVTQQCTYMEDWYAKADTSESCPKSYPLHISYFAANMRGFLIATQQICELILVNYFIAFKFLTWHAGCFSHRNVKTNIKFTCLKMLSCKGSWPAEHFQYDGCRLTQTNKVIHIETRERTRSPWTPHKAHNENPNAPRVPTIAHILPPYVTGRMARHQAKKRNTVV